MMKFSVFCLLLLSVSVRSFTIDQIIASASETGDVNDGHSDLTGDVTGDRLHEMDMMLTEEQRRELFAESSEEEGEAPPSANDFDIIPQQPSVPEEIIEEFHFPTITPSQVDSDYPTPPPNPVNQEHPIDLTPPPNPVEPEHPIDLTPPPNPVEPEHPIDLTPPQTIDEMIAQASNSDVITTGEGHNDLTGDYDSLHEMDMRLTEEQRQLLFGYMEKNKKETTTTTTTTTTTPEPTTTQSSAVTSTKKPCADANQHCFFARKDKEYCKTNTYIRMYCMESCGLCHDDVTDLCADKIDVCDHLKARGYCKGIFHEFMGTTCMKTCGFC